MAKLRTVIGLMSGTSMDGIDVALIATDGETIVERGAAGTFPYREEERDLLARALAAAPALASRSERPAPLEEAEAMVTARHADAVEAFLREHAGRVDAVGFHGQTVFHEPRRRLTVQIGDGQALADALGLPVVWDFRADDVAAGGEGAPLVPVYHRALAEAVGIEPPVAFLNMGGVANLTFVGASGELSAFDTGPGNAMIDDWVRRRTGRDFDAEGSLAAAGKVSEAHLARLLAHPYFDAPAPKSLDRNAFATEDLGDLSDADGAATFVAFTAESIARGLDQCAEVPRLVVACGGGRRNATLMAALRTRLAVPVRPAEAFGIDGDAIEAQAFGFLAVRRLDGRPITFPGTTGVPAPLTGGKISLPKA